MTHAHSRGSTEPLPPAATNPVNDEEVKRLLGLAGHKTRTGRTDLFNAISDLFEHRGRALNETERTLMVEILRALSQEVERSVRAALARRIAANDDVPAELVRLLANDEIEVAYPILVESAVLRDPELVEIVRHRSMQHQLAVAVRKEVSEPVSASLVESGDEDVIVSLLNNAGARISADVMEHLVEESRHVDRFRRPLVNRDDLPDDLARRMCAWVSAALRQHIVNHFQVDVHSLDDQLSDVVREVGGSVGTDKAESAAARLVDKLHDAGELSPRFMVKALGQGQVVLFELALARLTNVRVQLVRRIAYEAGGEALAVACRAIGVDSAAFANIYRLTRKARGRDEELDQVGLRRLVKFYEDTSLEAAKVVVRKWARDKDYLTALRSLEDVTSV